MHDLDTAMFGHLPITPVPRILVDLAPSAGRDELSRLCHQAWVRHEVAEREVEACAARAPHKPGLSKLRDALGADVRLSKLEDAFVALLSHNGLPLPRTNIDRHGDTVGAPVISPSATAMSRNAGR